MAKIKLDFLTDINMLLMIEKCMKGEIRHSICRYAKANTATWRLWSKESSYLQWDVNNLYGSGMSQKLSVTSFLWIKHNSQFNKDS